MKFPGLHGRVILLGMNINMEFRLSASIMMPNNRLEWPCYFTGPEYKNGV